MSYELSELYRLLNNIIQFGIVDHLEGDRAVCITANGLKTKPLPVGVERAGDDRSSWLPSVGEQVVILSPSGVTENAIIGASLWSSKHSNPSSNPEKPTMIFSDGTTISYDKANHRLSATLPAGGTVNIVGNLTVTGSIQATGNVSDGISSMQDDRSVYNGHKHTGNSGKPTSTPDRSQ